MRTWTIITRDDLPEDHDALLKRDSIPPDEGDGLRVVTAVDAAEVVRVLEEGYHPQNPSDMHPADLIVKHFKLDGHEGLVRT